MTLSYGRYAIVFACIQMHGHGMMKHHPHGQGKHPPRSRKGSLTSLCCSDCGFGCSSSDAGTREAEVDMEVRDGWRKMTSFFVVCAGGGALTEAAVTV